MDNEIKTSIENAIQKTTNIKTISMPVEIYNAEIKNAQLAGQRLIMAAVADIITTGGENVTVPESASKDMKEFISILKEKLNTDSE